MSAEPQWCLEPQEWFTCPSCEDGLYCQAVVARPGLEVLG